jgi:hypothetical protein
MKKTLIMLLIVGLFNGCLFHHPHHRSHYSDGYDNHSYRNTNHYYDDRSYNRQHNSYDRRDNHNYRNHGDARMNVTRHGR